MYDDDFDKFDKGDRWAGFRSGRTWIRGFFMLLLLAAMWFARVLLLVIAVFQFGAELISRRPVARLLPFSRSLAAWMREAVLFLTYNAEDKPFPFARWPEAGAPEPGAWSEEEGEFEEPWEDDSPLDPLPADEAEPDEAPPAAGDSPPPEGDFPEGEGDQEAEPEKNENGGEGRPAGKPPPRPDA